MKKLLQEEDNNSNNIIKADLNETEKVSSHFLNEMLNGSHNSLTKAISYIFVNFPDKASSIQNISSKLKRDSLNFTEMVMLADACGYDIMAVPKNQKYNIDKCDGNCASEKTECVKMLRAIMKASNAFYDSLRESDIDI